MSNQDKNREMPNAETLQSDDKQSPHVVSAKRKRKWWRIPLRVLFVLVVIVLSVPVLLYLPPVQTVVKNLACKIVKEETGMDVSIDRLRLKFPLDISLQGVSVVEAQGDTMVKAREAVADVKLLPLLHLDVKLKQLRLTDGYYRFVSPDSSMIMKIRAHELEVAPGSSVNILKSDIDVNKAVLRGGDISLYMDVWRKKPTPVDTTSTPFVIRLGELDAQDVKFAMSMLPTIDTLTLNAGTIKMRDGLINLRSNEITASSLAMAGGGFKYLAPTPEYVASHPAPVDTVTPPSPPMVIKADAVSVDNISGIYAIAGAKPLPGFDANYIEVSDVGVGLRNFYNSGASLRLPLTRITARERSGLQIVEGHGNISIDETGIYIADTSLRTPYSEITASKADVPFALMELKPDAPLAVNARASVGMPDVESFMPGLRPVLAKLPGRVPLNAVIDVEGLLSDFIVNRLDVAMPGVFSMRADGSGRNALDFKRLEANLTFDGELENPSAVSKLTGETGFEIPRLKISGVAKAANETYAADLKLLTDKGNLIGKGSVGLTSEAYNVDVEISRLNVGHFMPDLGVGLVSGSVAVKGAGFNPLKAGAATDLSLCIDEIFYNGRRLQDISLQGILNKGNYHFELDSPNDVADIEGIIEGTIATDDYTVSGDVKVHQLDLMSLGLSDVESSAKVDMSLAGRLQPERWLYDVDLDIDGCEYVSGDKVFKLPGSVNVSLQSTEHAVTAQIGADRTALRFESIEGLQKVVEGFTAASDLVMKQIDERRLNVEELHQLLPPFRLDGNVSGQGFMADMLAPMGLGLDTLSIKLANDSLIHGGIALQRLNTGSLTLDTLTLGLKQRNALLDYKIHMGNAPGTLDEFAQVNLNGYVGDNRLSAYLVQRNQQDVIGYRLGFTAALPDSIVSLHFTPLRATIAYMPWTFNDDNYVTCNLKNYQIHANLKASSRESSILLATEPTGEGDEQLHLNLSNIKIEDFLNMSLTAPPIKATVSSDVTVRYTGKALVGKGSLDIANFIYNKQRVGDFRFDLKAGTNMNDKLGGKITMQINGKDAMALSAFFKEEEGSDHLVPKIVKLDLTEFPLGIANPFLGADVLQLRGALNGSMKLTGTVMSPLLNGSIACDSVGIYIPMMGSTLKVNQDSISVADNILNLNNLKIYGANDNPLQLGGSVNAQKLSEIYLDLSANANNFQLINNDRRAKSDIYGKIFLTLGATVKGPMQHFDVNATLNVLGNTDAYYTLPSTMSTDVATTNTDGVVKFVNFNDTASVAAKDTVVQQMAMRIRAGLTISRGAQVCVNFDNSGTKKLTAQPSGTLNYYQNFMGDMTLNGMLTIGQGMIRYGFPVLGDKTFEFDPESYVQFNGNMMNPSFMIKATDKVRATVVNTSGNSQPANFLITVDVSGNLMSPTLKFDLSTNDDLTLQNELTSMSADQRSMQAINLLITGRYQGAGMKTESGNLVTGSLYSLLTSQLNSWAAQNIRGVDLSFGVDQYSQSRDGRTQNSTSYSYQVSKSLFSNKFKIVVGGNYTTDAAADENFAENLFSDVSFEYMLKQTNNLSMLVRLYRHVGYESILEGEVTDMGVGFVMRRRLDTLRNIFKVRWGKRKSRQQAIDSVTAETPAVRREGQDEMSSEAGTTGEGAEESTQKGEEVKK